MIVMRQGDSDTGILWKLLDKNGIVEIPLDTQKIANDLESLSEKLEKAKTKSERAELQNIVNTLQKLSNKISKDNTLVIWWFMEGGIVKAYPLEFKVLSRKYNIDMVDYIDVGKLSDNGHSVKTSKADKMKLVRVSVKDLLETIALEMMHRDLGETQESIEEKLNNIGIVGVYRAEELLHHFDIDAIELSRVFRIEDSPYLFKEQGKMMDYFGDKRFTGDYYKYSVDYSLKRALAIVLNRYLAKMRSLKMHYILCEVSTDGISFLINKDDRHNLIEVFGEELVIRAFGRKFEVIPDIEVRMNSL